MSYYICKMADSLEQTLNQFEVQLTAVEEALKLVTEGPDHQELLNLKEQLEEALSLTRDEIKMDLELQKFQQEMAEMGAEEGSQSSPQEEPKAAMDESQATMDESQATMDEPQASSDKPSTSQEEVEEDLEAQFQEMVGSKCQAPYGHEWGQHSYHNALISEADSTTGQVKVLFIHPIHQKMKPCPYFLQETCTYGESCRFSHGHPVDFSSIREYEPPDFTRVKVGGVCLARYKDELWYRAMILDILDDDHVAVQYERHNGIHQLDLPHIYPLDDEEEEEESPDEEMESLQEEEMIEESASTSSTKSSWVPQDPTRRSMGQWEQYTKGVGSALMAKMGYVWGQGLGKDGSGRVEPVDAIILPAGKSLDHCMKIREQSMTGEHETIQSRMVEATKPKRIKKPSTALPPHHSKSVFEFINREVFKQASLQQASSSWSSLEDNKNLNVQSLKVSQELKQAEGKLQQLQTSLKRNQDKDKVAAAVIQTKMAAQQQKIGQLRQREKDLELRQKSQKEHRKLTIF